jgi:hypothetical protein
LIAEQRFISRRTAGKHGGHILRTLGARACREAATAIVAVVASRDEHEADRVVAWHRQWRHRVSLVRVKGDPRDR